MEETTSAKRKRNIDSVRDFIDNELPSVTISKEKRQDLKRAVERGMICLKPLNRLWSLEALEASRELETESFLKEHEELTRKMTYLREEFVDFLSVNDNRKKFKKFSQGLNANMFLMLCFYRLGIFDRYFFRAHFFKWFHYDWIKHRPLEDGKEMPKRIVLSICPVIANSPKCDDMLSDNIHCGCCVAQGRLENFLLYENLYFSVCVECRKTFVFQEKVGRSRTITLDEMNQLLDEKVEKSKEEKLAQ